MGHCLPICLLVLVTTVITKQNQDMPICANKRPCDVVFGNMINGRLSPMTSKQASCACSNRPCPVGWQENGNRSITMEIASNPVTLVAQFLFCDDVPFVRDCVGSEVAMKTRGYGVMPDDIEEYNCKCPGGDALVLKSSLFIPRIFSNRRSYTCHIPACEPKNTRMPVCMTTRRTRYGFAKHVKCSCPEKHKCLMKRGSTGHCEAA